jgi:predicted RNA methylase
MGIMAVSGDRAAVAARLGDAGWTPGSRDLPGLLDLLAGEDEELARAAERAVLRIEARQRARVVTEIVARVRDAVRPARARLTRLAGRLAGGAGDDPARRWILDALTDPDPKTRHVAARAAGKLASAGSASGAVERALLAAWDAASGDEDRRALAEALGKVGSAAARERLASAAGELGARGARAGVMIDRSEARQAPGAIDPTAAPAAPLVIRFHARAGLERIVADEIGDGLRPRVAGPGVVEARLTGPLTEAVAIRTATHVGCPLEPEPIAGGLPETIVRALTSGRATDIFQTFTRPAGGRIRFRLAFVRGGHRRALAWRCAELVREASPSLVNDPTGSTWEVTVDDDAGRVALELLPRGFDDERFAYRTRVVPASSHPTIAAALARVAPRRDDDVVWDPFVGAGAELVERARLGPYRTLLGTDVEPGAIDAARANLAAAGVSGAELTVASALAHAPSGVTVIVTNPPMGRRVQRGSHADLLERFVVHAAAVLAPGGALVWTVPEPRRIHARAARAGLVLERAWEIDMGGFPAALSVHRAPETRPGPRPGPDA